RRVRVARVHHGRRAAARAARLPRARGVVAAVGVARRGGRGPAGEPCLRAGRVGGRRARRGRARHPGDPGRLRPRRRRRRGRDQLPARSRRLPRAARVRDGRDRHGRAAAARATRSRRRRAARRARAGARDRAGLAVPGGVMKRMRAALAADDGSTLPLVAFFGMLGLAVVLIVTAATSLYLEKKRLFTVADGAALVGAEAFELDSVSFTPDGPRPTLESDDVAAAAADYLAGNPAPDLDGLAIE